MFGINTKSRGLAVSVGVAASLIIATVSTLAHATDAFTTVGVVEYAPNSLLVQGADGVNYLAKINAPSGCTSNNQTIDTLKAWQSLAQAALLSGKTVRIYYNVCSSNSQNYIAAMDLDK